MRHTATHRRTIDLLFAAITLEMGEGGQFCSFLFGPPGSSIHNRRMGIDIYFHDPAMTQAVLYVRKQGPVYLRTLPIDSIRSALSTFVTENFWYLADECFGKGFPGTFAENLSESVKEKMADVLAGDAIFNPVPQLFLFPLVAIKVETDFDSDAFFLVNSDGLVARRLPPNISEGEIISQQFPPIRNWEGRKERPQSWLGIRAVTKDGAEAMKAIVLGALALTPLQSYRHMFSGRTVFGGRCGIARSITTNFSDAHTPPIMHDIVITDADTQWLSILADKIIQNQKTVLREMRALRYFYRAWFLPPSERFPWLCMSLDAVFGEAGSVAKAIIDSVRTTVGPHVEDSRLRKLMDLRAAALHGGAPDIYESSKFDDYYVAYLVDPVKDLELIVGFCLRARIFDSKLVEHVDPNEQVIKDAQAAGRLPSRLYRPTILDAVSVANS